MKVKHPMGFNKSGKVFSVMLLACSFSISILTGCKKTTAYLQDPNKPVHISPGSILPGISRNAFANSGGMADVAMRYLVRTDLPDGYQTLVWTVGDYDDYAMLRQVSKLQEEAVYEHKAYYLGIAKFFRAYYFFRITRMFGDVPYIEALKGEDKEAGAGRLKPVYDRQKDIITGILDELETANGLMAQYKGTIVEGDITYGGNLDKWRRLSNTFALRVLMQLSLKENDPALQVKERFAAIVNHPEKYPLMTGNEDNAVFRYLDESGNRSSFYNSSGLISGAYRFSAGFINQLKDRKDPRLFLYADITTNAASAGLRPDNFNAYSGVDASMTLTEIKDSVSAGNVSKVNARYYTQPVIEPYVMMGYWELQFLLAEAAQRKWINGNAADYYESGIKANFEYYQLSAVVDTYLQQENVKYKEATGIWQINMQKYLAGFYQSGWECFFNYHRTGVPDIRFGKGQVKDHMPYRWLYPRDESLLNGVNLQAAIHNQGFIQDDVDGTLWIYQPY
jgi:hypothetical protein